MGNTTNNFTLEIIGFNIEGCRIAQAAGANRIELCDNPTEGGSTPSYGFIKAARALLNIPLYPMIHPRGGDFCYSDADFNIIKADIHVCKELDCDGVVIGILNTNGSIDKKRTAQLVELAYPLGVTFHRAFDRCANPFEALEHIIDIGCERILTSGQQLTAPEGAALISELIKQSADRIIIMPGSGVKSSNITQLATTTGATEFHASARIWADSKMQHSNSSMKEQLQSVTVDEQEVKRLMELLNEL
ncbi:MAG: copper homeostasis protein CutC [Chitinophagaceae bacterium]|nr:copper homeostasis protein CutC [Chitinophagaceae bacterium]